MAATAQIIDRVRLTSPSPIPADNGSNSGTVAGGGAATLVVSAGTTGAMVGITSVDWSYAVAPTSGSIQISDGTTTWGPFPVTVAGFQTKVFNPPLLFAKNTAVTVTLADGSQSKCLAVSAVFYGRST